MQNGWIKIHRRMVDKGFYKKSQYVHLWIHLLLNANHEPKEFMWNGNIILVKEGQMISGRKELSQHTNIPESTIEDILKFLESQHQIQQQKTNKYRLITIVNWVKHQNSNSKSNNTPTTGQQHANTNKNVRRIRMKEEYIAGASPAEWSLEDSLKKMEEIPNSYKDIIATFIREKGFKIENSKQLSTVISRYVRVSQKLAGGWTTKDIFNAIDKIKQDNKKREKRGDEVDWTLETILKTLTK